jgi:transcriptional regulator with XRE-family HTH domain
VTFEIAITRYRIRAGLSISELSHRAGMAHSAVSLYESGERHPTRATLIHLANILELNREDRIRLLLTAGYVPSFVADQPDLLDDLVALMVSKGDVHATH